MGALIDSLEKSRAKASEIVVADRLNAVKKDKERQLLGWLAEIKGNKTQKATKKEVVAHKSRTKWKQP